MISRIKSKKLWIVVSVLILLGVAIFLLRGEEDGWVKDANGNWAMHGNPEVKDFESCAKKYPVLESYPEQCAMPNGPTFTKQY